MAFDQPKKHRGLKRAASVGLLSALLFVSGACWHDPFTPGPVCRVGEEIDCYSGPKGTEGVGACRIGYRVCRPDREGFGPCNGETLPTAEVCAPFGMFQEDENCDGTVNEGGAGCECTDGETEPCYEGPEGTEGVGTCSPGTRTCVVSLWGPCEDATLPEADDCKNDLDEDCDGRACAAPLFGLLAGDAKNQGVLAMAHDESGNLLVTGFFEGNLNFGTALSSLGSTDAFVAKFSPKGQLLWAQRAGDLGSEAGFVIAAAPIASASGEADVVVAGTFADDFYVGNSLLTNGGGLDVFVAKLDGKTGEPLWAVAKGRDGNQKPLGVSVAPSGDVYVAGTFMDYFYCPGQTCGSAGSVKSKGGTDVFVVRLGADDGTEMARQVFGGAFDENANAIVFREAKDGGSPASVTVVGDYRSDMKIGDVDLVADVDANKDGFVAEFEADTLAPKSAFGFGDEGEQTATAVAVRDGDLLIGGTTTGAIDWGFATVGSFGVSRSFVTRLGKTTETSWAQTFDGSNFRLQLSIAKDGRIAVGGSFNNGVALAGDVFSSAGGYDMFVAQLAPDGAPLWAKTFGGAGDDFGAALSVAPDGAICLGGAVSSLVDFGLQGLVFGGGQDAAVGCFAP